MNVRLNQAGDHQSPVEIVLQRLGSDMRLDRSDASVADADIDQVAGLSGNTGASEYEVEWHELLRRLGAAEVGGLELGIVGQRRGLACAHDAAGLQDVAPIGDG